jgi:hypothetical protein
MAAEYPNWFDQTAKENFERFLIPLAGQDKLNFLQLGAFTGDASVWLSYAVLTGKDSLLVDVDTWQGSNEGSHHAMDFDDVYETYLDKTEELDNIIHKKMTTTMFLFHNRDERYDFIYVDAGHTSADAFLDGELSWPLLKSGGILAFDDYTWNSEDGIDIHAPKIGVGIFIDRHRTELEILAVNTQMWVKKK